MATSFIKALVHNVPVKKLLFAGFLVFFTGIICAQVIPGDRRVDWTGALQSYHFKEPLIRLNIMDYGGDSLGTTDNSEAFSKAVTVLNGRCGEVYFPSGTYLFRETLQIPDSLTIRGDGASNTHVIFNLNHQPVDAIQIKGSAEEDFVALSGGYQKGSNKIWTASGNQFQTGDWVEIREKNGSWNTVPADWAAYAVGQIEQIVDISGDTLFLSNALRIDYDQNLEPQIQKINPVKNAGIQCLSLKRVDSTGNGGGYNMFFGLAANCRVRAVESDSSNGSHVYISRSTLVRITGCAFMNAFLYDGTATHGYGLTIADHSGACLIADNTFHRLRHAMMVKAGANGNVFSYNYSHDVYRTEFPVDLSGDISLHGHYPFANLFEGNVVQNMIIDHYWGPAGPWNTFFRNRADSWGIIMTPSDTTETGRQNFVGNETTNDSFYHGQFEINDNDNFLYGNKILGAWIPSGTNDLNDSSYYLSTPPFYWPDSISWPVDIPNATNRITLPAESRYQTGIGYAYCDSGFTTGIAVPERVQEITLYPNPTRGIFYIVIPETQLHQIPFAIFSLEGKEILKGNLKTNTNPVQFHLPESLPPGVYFLQLTFRNQLYRNKIILL